MSNPLAFLGLRRRGEKVAAEEDEDSDQVDKVPKLNRRGLPARKRKLNSLICGSDDLVSIPVKSPKKRGPKTAADSPRAKPLPMAQFSDDDDDGDDNNVGAIDDEDEDEFNDVDPLSPDMFPADDEPELAKVATPKKKKTKKGGQPINQPNNNQDQDPELSSPEKKSAQRLGVALRNLLKLPKGHRWVCFEFFYSTLDRVLFEGENDFMVCLRESLPLLKTRRLSRVEWSKVRRMMGKPRRCSAAFFAEERAELARKRQKIRMLQQRKQADFSTYKDLPDFIPLQLTIGAKITARLRKPQDGLFLGIVDAYDTSNNTYRVRFDRNGLGTHSVPDEEVLASADDVETLPLSTFTSAKVRPRPSLASQQPSPMHLPLVSPPRSSSLQLANDPLLSGNTPRARVVHMDGQVGGYPIKFLEQIVRLSKCLKQKRERVGSLRDLNSQGERRKSFGEFINEDFQRRYAATVIDLANINRDLNEYLRNIQEFTQEFAPEAGPTISLPNIIREGCQEDSYDMVNKNNTAEERECVESPKTLALVSSLTALMCLLHRLADGERNAFELQALQDSLADIKQNLSTENLPKFENCVEVHMQHIQSGLSQLGNLRAFVMPPTSTTTAATAKSTVVNVKSEQQ